VKFLARFYIDGFVLAIFGAVVLATLLPAQGAGETAVHWATKAAIALLFLLYGARLSPSESLAGLKHWRLHSVVFTFTFVVFPAFGLALRVLEPAILTEDLYTGVLFLCLVPSTVQSSIAFTSIAQGNVGGAIVSASLSNLLGVFVTPLLVILLMDTTGKAHVNLSSVLDIMLQILLPFVVGQLIRPFVKDWLVRHARPTKLVDRGSILLVVYAAFSEGMNEHIWSLVSPWQIAAVVLVSLGVLAAILSLTAFTGRRLGFSLPDQIVIIFCGSKKSLATGVPMAAVLFAGQPLGLIVLPLMIFHQIQLIACAALAQHFARKHEERAARARLAEAMA
jgi:sodium/bile acid cotransporter 7